MTKKAKKSDKSIKLMDYRLFSSTKDRLLRLLTKVIHGESGLLTITTPNPEQVVLAHHHPGFKTALQSADILIPDGIGLVWASQFLAKHSGDQRLTERIAGVDVAAEVLKVLPPKDKVLIIGGRDYADSNLQTGQTICEYHSGCTDQEISDSQVWWMEGFEQVSEATSLENKSILQAVDRLKPSVVLVAFGAPWQEEWLLENKSILATNNVKIAMVVGGAIDFLTGKVPRAPKYIQKIGLEWLFRLFKQPWRWKRQVKLLEFVWLVFLTRFGLLRWD